jgi:hypothetical protein
MNIKRNVHMNICSYILSRNRLTEFPNILTTHPVYCILAEMPGFARDSIRNEGTREMNYGIL